MALTRERPFTRVIRHALDGASVPVLPAHLSAEKREELAVRLAAGPTRSLGLSKRLLNESFETDLTRALDREGAYQSMAATSADLHEGMAAFTERRDPNFTGA